MIEMLQSSVEVPTVQGTRIRLPCDSEEVLVVALSQHSGCLVLNITHRPTGRKIGVNFDVGRGDTVLKRLQGVRDELMAMGVDWSAVDESYKPPSEVTAKMDGIWRRALRELSWES